MSTLKQLPETLDLKFVRGDDFEFDVVVSDDDGNAVDFSQWSNLKFQVRTTELKGAELLDEYTDPELAATAGGRLKLTLPSADTSSWEDNRVDYEVDGTDGNGILRSVIRGSIHLSHEISR